METNRKPQKGKGETMIEVYIIMSPDGGLSLDLSTGKGKCYITPEKATEALKSKNEWSKAKGYGVYELVTLEVKDLALIEKGLEDKSALTPDEGMKAIEAWEKANDWICDLPLTNKGYNTPESSQYVSEQMNVMLDYITAVRSALISAQSFRKRVEEKLEMMEREMQLRATKANEIMEAVNTGSRFVTEEEEHTADNYFYGNFEKEEYAIELLTDLLGGK